MTSACSIRDRRGIIALGCAAGALGRNRLIPLIFATSAFRVYPDRTAPMRGGSTCGLAPSFHRSYRIDFSFESTALNSCVNAALKEIEIVYSALLSCVVFCRMRAVLPGQMSGLLHIETNVAREGCVNVRA